MKILAVYDCDKCRRAAESISRLLPCTITHISSIGSTEHDIIIAVICRKKFVENLLKLGKPLILLRRFSGSVPPHENLVLDMRIDDATVEQLEPVLRHVVRQVEVYRSLRSSGGS